jgi:polyphosphate kinase
MQPRQFGKMKFEHLLVSQFNMMKRFDKMIDREISHAKAGKPAGITIKVNNLQERHLIEKLYQASKAGVEVRLLVRSICCLAPATARQSKNIQVRRMVDRYLEHARIFRFENNGQPEYYMGSADWMNRNLHSRIEVVFPLYDDLLKAQVEQILQIQWQDTRKSVLFDRQYRNVPISMDGNGEMAAQEKIYRFVQELKDV